MHNWMSAYNHKVPRFGFKQLMMNWEYVKKNSSTYRYILEPTMLPETSLPEKIFLTFTLAESFFGSWKKIAGHLIGKRDVC